MWYAKGKDLSGFSPFKKAVSTMCSLVTPTREQHVWKSLRVTKCTCQSYRLEVGVLCVYLCTRVYYPSTHLHTLHVLPHATAVAANHVAIVVHEAAHATCHVVAVILVRRHFPLSRRLVDSFGIQGGRLSNLQVTGTKTKIYLVALLS